MKAPFPERLDLPPGVIEIARRLEAAGYAAWCVGGALRDTILDDVRTDVDLATSATPDQVQALFRRTVPIGIAFGTVGVLDAGGTLHEVTTFRRDVSTDGRRAVVAFGASLEEDLARRDFTVNAIAYHPLRHEWLDPFDGRGDLGARTLRAVGDPNARFREDYLRILRAIRFSARFSLRIDPPTWHAMRSAAQGLAGLSVERVRDEWFKTLQTARTLQAVVTLWHESEAAAVCLPELRPSEGVREPGGLPRDPIVLTVLLCHNPGLVLARLKASNTEIARATVAGVVPQAPLAGDERTVRRWLGDIRDAEPDLRLLAQYRDLGVPEWASVVDAIRARGDALTRGDLAITGVDLLAAGIPAGPMMGRLLDALLEKVLDEPATNTRERLLALARELSL